MTAWPFQAHSKCRSRLHSLPQSIVELLHAPRFRPDAFILPKAPRYLPARAEMSGVVSSPPMCGFSSSLRSVFTRYVVRFSLWTILLPCHSFFPALMRGLASSLRHLFSTTNSLPDGRFALAFRMMTPPRCFADCFPAADRTPRHTLTLQRRVGGSPRFFSANPRPEPIDLKSPASLFSTFVKFTCG